VNAFQKLLTKSVSGVKIHIKLDRAIISFTFDDIAESAVTKGALLLDKNGVRGTYYVSAGLLEQTGPNFKYASRNDIKALAESGHHIGGHTFSHASVKAISIHELDREIKLNREILQALTNQKTIEHFSYPFGAVTISAKKFLGKRFKTMRGIFAGVNRRRADLALLKSWAMYDRNSSKKLIETLLEQNKKAKGWLIFYTHDISDRPSPWGSSPEQLEFVLKKSIASRCQVLTIEQAYNRILSSLDAD